MALQEVAHLVGQRRSFVGHDPDQLGGPALQPPPLIEELGDATVEPFVGRAQRLRQEVVGLPEGRRTHDVAPTRRGLAHRDEQTPTGARMDLAEPW